MRIGGRLVDDELITRAVRAPPHDLGVGDDLDHALGARDDDAMCNRRGGGGRAVQHRGRTGLESEPRREGVLGVDRVRLAVPVGAFGDRDPALRGRVLDFAHQPPERVDHVRAPRADPASTAGAVEEPAVLA